jgi:3-hydroxyisobutyrate dehydrogenase-like beta-hydroxyacid dehydrogenase
MTPLETITKNHRLGFIGLGHLGWPMARRLLSAGFPMVVYNRDINKTKSLSILGAEVAPDPGELAGEVAVVLSCLADAAAVGCSSLRLRDARAIPLGITLCAPRAP